jgi:hypothetical protein
MRSDEFHQMMTERLQMLTEAVDRAEQGTATPEDWAIIRYECGLERKENAYSARQSEHVQASPSWITSCKVLSNH